MSSDDYRRRPCEEGVVEWRERKRRVSKTRNSDKRGEGGDREIKRRTEFSKNEVQLVAGFVGGEGERRRSKEERKERRGSSFSVWMLKSPRRMSGESSTEI